MSGLRTVWMYLSLRMSLVAKLNETEVIYVGKHFLSLADNGLCASLANVVEMQKVRQPKMHPRQSIIRYTILVRNSDVITRRYASDGDKLAADF